jgi:hypothetical protein
MAAKQGPNILLFTSYRVRHIQFISVMHANCVCPAKLDAGATQLQKRQTKEEVLTGIQPDKPLELSLCASAHTHARCPLLVTNASSFQPALLRVTCSEPLSESTSSRRCMLKPQTSTTTPKMNRIHLVLFDMKNRIFEPYLAAIHKISISVMHQLLDTQFWPALRCHRY